MIKAGRIIGILIILSSITPLGLGISFFVKTSSFLEKSVKAQGTVLDLRERKEKKMSDSDFGKPILYKKIKIPPDLLTKTGIDGKDLTYGGDIRIGDLQGKGKADFLIYRSVDDAYDGGGMKPCFLGAFTIDGEILWTEGEEGEQPTRPGPVAIHDIDRDGFAEVICFFIDPAVQAPPNSMKNVVIQIRDGKTGKIKQQASPYDFRACSGSGPNWCHQRILIANFRGNDTPQDFVVKLGDKIIAFDENINVLWTYTIKWNKYPRCSAYIPAVGDINGDGKDEVNGGYFLLSHDGTALWENQLGSHMDSVAITEWDDGHTRAICSGFGHVLDEHGNIVLRLGEKLVPHGQEIRVARFVDSDTSPQMIIRYNGHNPDVMIVGTKGNVLRKFKLNVSPNNTGMEVIYWNGFEVPALLYNGGMLWYPIEGVFVVFPDLPEPVGPRRMGWYHCIPTDICGDGREEVLIYNPWDTSVYIYTPYPLKKEDYGGYQPCPRQYNVRLMD